jgi:hypothetical protein
MASALFPKAHHPPPGHLISLHHPPSPFTHGQLPPPISHSPSKLSFPGSKFPFLSPQASSPLSLVVSSPQKLELNPSLTSATPSPPLPRYNIVSSPLPHQSSPSPLILPPGPISLPAPPPTVASSLPPSSSQKLVRHSPRLSRFHPYVKQDTQFDSTTYTKSSTTSSFPPGFPLPVSPPPPKRKWDEIDDIPLAVLKKYRGQHLFPGFMSNIELAALSLTSLKDGGSSQGTFLTISSQQQDERQSSPPSAPQEIVSLTESLSPVADISVSSTDSPRVFRRFSRSARGLDVFSSLQAAHHTGSSSKPAVEQLTVTKGVDQEGLPPQQ